MSSSEETFEQDTGRPIRNESLATCLKAAREEMDSAMKTYAEYWKFVYPKHLNRMPVSMEVWQYKPITQRNIGIRRKWNRRFVSSLLTEGRRRSRRNETN